MKRIRGVIAQVAGPTVIADGMGGIRMNATARVGRERLLGEVIKIDGELATIQVYEDTAGISLGDEVLSTGKPLTVELGPGLLAGVFDGIQRPLEALTEKNATFIEKGVHPRPLSRSKLWKFEPRVEKGERVSGGDIIGVVQETAKIEHRIMVPVGIEGVVEEVRSGEFRVDEHVVTLDTGKHVHLMQEWSVREPRHHRGKRRLGKPFLTGQRVFDTLFPLAEGGVAIVPGGFGTGKTVVQHTLARYARSDIIVYVGCGERGNEMAEVLQEFPKLTDPESGLPLSFRTVLIVNTSNMPVAAREASIYTGITIAEYYRDMGYTVSLMADSTSRWAEAMREISSRLEELPGEEGFPPYLSTRLGSFYERAGSVEVLGRPEREGSISVISAVSPPGGDFSEPVTQASLRVAGVLWALDRDLAYSRHFPAVSWSKSFSLYMEGVKEWMSENLTSGWMELRERIMVILQKEGEVKDIARLVGVESLQDSDRILLEVGEVIREVFLRQSIFNDNDVFASLEKQFLMMRCIIEYYDSAVGALGKGVFLERVLGDPVRVRLLNMQNIPRNEFNTWAEELIIDIDKAFASEDEDKDKA
ncbi:MAG: V-type ATP synthase subunit A [Thermodesulfobacteriota bacterium]